MRIQENIRKETPSLAGLSHLLPHVEYDARFKKLQKVILLLIFLLIIQSAWIVKLYHTLHHLKISFTSMYPTNREEIIEPLFPSSTPIA